MLNVAIQGSFLSAVLGWLIELKERAHIFTKVKVVLLNCKKYSATCNIPAFKYQHQNILEVPKVEVFVMHNGPFII